MFQHKTFQKNISLAQVVMMTITEVKLVPEAKMRDIKDSVVLFPLSNLGRKSIQMAQSMARGPIFLNIDL